MAHSYDCPYLDMVKGDVIRCEFARIKPPDTEARAAFLKDHCGHDKHYKDCPFYKIMDDYYRRKYSEEDVKW